MRRGNDYIVPLFISFLCGLLWSLWFNFLRALKRLRRIRGPAEKVAVGGSGVGPYSIRRGYRGVSGREIKVESGRVLTLGRHIL